MKIRRFLDALPPVALALALVGCIMSPEATPEAVQLTFEVQLHIDANGQTVAELGVHNTGEGDFAGDKNFCGVTEICNEEGEPRARMDVVVLNHQLASGEAVVFERWKGRLSPGTYTLTWGAPDYGSTVVDFTVVERNGRLSIGEQVTQVFDDYEPQAIPAEGEKVYPLAVGPGEWLEYEIASASNFQLLPGIAIQQGDRVRFETVGIGTGKKMGLDMTTTVSFETPLCDVYVNGEQVGERVGEEGTIIGEYYDEEAAEYFGKDPVDRDYHVQRGYIDKYDITYHTGMSKLKGLLEAAGSYYEAGRFDVAANAYEQPLGLLLPDQGYDLFGVDSPLSELGFNERQLAPQRSVAQPSFRRRAQLDGLGPAAIG